MTNPSSENYRCLMVTENAQDADSINSKGHPLSTATLLTDALTYLFGRYGCGDITIQIGPTETRIDPSEPKTKLKLVE